MTTRRSETKLARRERLKPRVVDCLCDMGHGDQAQGKVRFLEHALWVGAQRELRLWSGDKHMQLRSAGFSLASLLGENKYGTWDTTKTAGNNHWVMDVWEAACDDWFRVKQAKVEEVERVQPEVEVISEAGLAVMRKLSTRILDAYLARDSDAILEALQELERRGM